MPKRSDVNSVLIIGSGPIVIGQAAEFDYSGSQACRALKEEGVKVIVVNSNPATIQTDLDMADRVYIEPLTPGVVAEIIRRERPDAILPTMGGQTGLNIAVNLEEMGVLAETGTKVIGTQVEAIRRAEDRKLFYELVRSIGEPIPESFEARSFSEALEAVRELGGYPVLCRPSYMLGGAGSGVARNDEELKELVSRALSISLNRTVSIDKYLDGWKEYEYEVIRDSYDNCITVCNMENVDPMGIHTGESIVVAPAQTLTDEEHQLLRAIAIKVVRALDVQGACNIQFAVNPERFEYAVIEVNPRVSRSSALASKATGYPIARVAAKIALGFRLDEIKNRVTGKTTAAFEPSLDYVVVKIPRWPFDIFREVSPVIGTQMKSTGETMAIGRTFEEALQKAVRSLEIGRTDLDLKPHELPKDNEELKHFLSTPTDKRLFYVYAALKRGMSVSEVSRLTRIDPWFISKIKNIAEMEERLRKVKLDDPSLPEVLLKAKRMGFSDTWLARLLGMSEPEVRELRKRYGIRPAYKMVDTCAAEFEAITPYYYSTYGEVDESSPSERPKVVIVGSGPIRIGQGIEFDYCTVHAVTTLREMGIEAIVVNNNPETVSTDFDISDKLYFEPLTFEDVMNVIEEEKPLGVILQLGGQTPLNIAKKLAEAGVKILGTPFESIDIAEDRSRFNEFLKRLGIPQPAGGSATSLEEAKEVARKIGYPVLVRPSYVLGGKAMAIVNDEEELEEYVREAVMVSSEHPILIDSFLYPAVEVDVDAVSDGEDIFIGGMMEHVEVAGVHSGDAAMVVPPQKLSIAAQEKIKRYTKEIVKALGVIGLMNVQYAVLGDEVYVLEVNPRSSRTVPFISKAIGIPLVKVATRIMMGEKLRDLGLTSEVQIPYVAVKESVFSFSRLPDADPALGPKMKSTGETMGLGDDFASAYYKAELGAGMRLPEGGKVIVHAHPDMSSEVEFVANELRSLGFGVVLAKEVYERLSSVPEGVEVAPSDELRNEYDVIEYVKNEGIGLIINLTPIGSYRSQKEGYALRRAAVIANVPYITTFMGVLAAIKTIKEGHKLSVKSLNEYHQLCKAKTSEREGNS